MPFELDSAELLSISSVGELAIKLQPVSSVPFMTKGTLARMPLAGGAPRLLIENVSAADWAPDGSDLAVVREFREKSRLEFPPGHVLFETAGVIRFPRISPDGNRIAFLHAPSRGLALGVLEVVDKSSRVTELAPGVEFTAVAWASSGDEVWFGQGGELWAMTLDGKKRLLMRVPEVFDLQDVSRDGRILASLRDQRMRAFAMGPRTAGAEQDLSWLQWSLVADVSPDGVNLLFSESGQVCLRETNGSSVTVLGEGWAWGLSPDGKWALATGRRNDQIRMLPTGPGEPRSLPRGPIQSYGWGAWFPDGKRIAFVGSEPGHGARLYVQNVEGGLPRAISPEGIGFGTVAVSPDGDLVVARGPDRRPWFFPTDGSAARPVPGLDEKDYPIRFDAKAPRLYFFPFEPLPSSIYRLDARTGRREAVHPLAAGESAAVEVPGPVAITPDGRYYAHSYLHVLSRLYVIEGPR